MRRRDVRSPATAGPGWARNDVEPGWGAVHLSERVVNRQDMSAGFPAMPRILLVHGPMTRDLRTLARILRSIPAEVDTLTEVTRITRDSPYDLLLVDYDSLFPKDRDWIFEQRSVIGPEPRMVIFSRGECEGDLSRLF